jgi:16S rRNA (cytosine1402-N4)-methyltransferase
MTTSLTHTSVLMKEVLEALDIQPHDTVVDATIGGAGHFTKMVEKLSSGGVIVGIDADSNAIERAKAVQAPSGVRVEIVHNNFRNFSEILESLSIDHFDKALFDLGWSSFQLHDGRGLSFKTNDPLSMSYDTRPGIVSAADIVNTYDEASLADIIHTLGEERFARAIAQQIVEQREKAPLLTTFDLVKVIEDATPAWYRRGKIHPATKTFQALRIAVNDELTTIQKGLKGALSKVSAGGVIAVITFHSIEDRIVKHLFRDAVHSGCGELIQKKPVAPSREEVVSNPRSRSAKLRAFVRTVRADQEPAAHVCQTMSYA